MVTSSEHKGTRSNPPSNGSVQTKNPLAEISQLLLGEAAEQSDLSAVLSKEVLSKELDSQVRRSLSELANSLFHAAPDEYLAHRSSTELIDITVAVQKTLDEFMADDQKFFIRHFSVGTRSLSKEALSKDGGSTPEIAHPEKTKGLSQTPLCRLICVLGDRPFIINSLRECIIQSGGSIEIFLHPILQNDGQRTSCSYIEVSGLSLESQELLKRNLERTLEHVIAATDDFTPVLARIETLARVIESDRAMPLFSTNDRSEAAQLLRWLSDGGFLFTGLSIWKAHRAGELPTEVETQLGIHRLSSSFASHLQEEFVEDVQILDEQQDLLTVSRLRLESLVQRRSQLMSFSVLEPSTDGTRFTCYQFTGLFTSKALSEESSEIPFLKRKLHEIIKLEGALEQSHNHKAIVNIFNSMPKEEAFRLDVEALRSVIQTVLAIQNRNETRVSVRFDKNKRGATVLTVMPRDKFNSTVRHKIQEAVEHTFLATPGSSEYFLDLSNKPHARFYFHVPLPKHGISTPDVVQLQTEIANLTRGWRENLDDQIRRSDLILNREEVLQRFEDAFDGRYQALQSVADAEHDLFHMIQLSAETPYAFSMRPTEEGQAGDFFLVVYKLGQPLTISSAFPILEHAGLEVLNERTFTIRPKFQEPISIHRFLVRSKSRVGISIDSFNGFLAPGLLAVFQGEAHDDLLNELFVAAELPVEAVALLRTYCSLLWQVNKVATKSAIQKALVSAPTFAQGLWNLFELRFHPQSELSLESRLEKFATALSRFRDDLRGVKDITTDRILRALSQLLEHTTRTNFYQPCKTPALKTIALKIQSERVEIMPQPRPLFEIFVRGKRLEGVHLRAGRVARGGLRWSDRHQDFRQEVLDLVKTQNIKNALIVPVGAKGGFVVKDLPESPTDQKAAVESAYKDFIRSLLSVTDNRVGDEVVRPPFVVAYDGDDPYLVVAADKGTATFSDIANGIAVDEFQFWLGDAFASGGSNGYDHKKYGITAKGAWESVKQHFSQLGIDLSHDTFTVSGIGDMSGDVFGNGLIESDKIRLIAAFNHKHIFLDPDPDAATSFQERLRLFGLPRSGWSDYLPELISEGGGVFERSAREIPITPQVRRALGLPDKYPDMVDGEQLISAILKAPVDLLWNGGIGTYIKAKQESNADVNDGTNDRVRVNADEVRARVIGEGGNLGLTQKARIELAKKGCFINTDAIDNSGGVDLSDHEVNLKILFQGLVADGKLTIPARNELLKEISGDVVKEVLRHNFNHALALTIGAQRSRRSVDYFLSLLREMTRLGFINRQLDQLPDDEELLERFRKKQGLWKPELAICLAAVKRWVKSEIEQSRLTQDPLLADFLLHYFPKKIRDLYAPAILVHPLRHNIIATQVTNELIDSLGITFVHRMCLTHSTSGLNVMKATLAADQLIQARLLREEVRDLQNHNGGKTLLILMQESQETLRELAAWLIGQHPDATLEQMVADYAEGFQHLLSLEGSFLSDGQQDLYRLRLEKYRGLGLQEATAQCFAQFPNAALLMEILWTSRTSKSDLVRCASIYTKIIELLSLDEILACATTIEVKSKWEAELLITVMRDIRRSISLLTCRYLAQQEKLPKEKQAGSTVSLDEQLLHHSHSQRVSTLIDEFKSSDPSLIELTVMARHLLQLPEVVFELGGHS